MARKFSISIVFSTLLIGIAISCQKPAKEEEIVPPPPPPTTPPPPPVEYVTSSVSGHVLDTQGNPVTGAEVKAGTASFTTDSKGQFSFTGISINKKAAIIKVEKAGFFQGSRTIIPIAGKDNYVRIQLTTKAVAGKFTGSAGGSISISSDAKVQFDAGSVIKADSTAYTGEVTVYAHFIDPTAAGFRDIMPGALLSSNTNHQLIGLTTFGILNVELAGSSGEKLLLAKNKPATVTIPIPASMQSYAPATLPLWYFNAATGLWTEEGSAVRQGQTYVGKTTHFSFWSTNVSYPLVDFKVVIAGKNGAPIIHANVEITGSINGNNTSGNGFTNAEGMTGGKIPANQSLQLSVYSPCGGLLQKQSIGPFSTAADMDTIRIDSYSETPITLTGTISNCTGDIIKNGVVNIVLDGIAYTATVTNGEFSVIVPRCTADAAEAKIKAKDLSTLQESNEITQTVKDTVHNFGLIATCTTQPERYIVLKFRNQILTFIPPAQEMYLSSDGGPFLQNARDDWNHYRVFFSYPSYLPPNPMPYPVTSTFFNLYMDNQHYQETFFPIVLKEHGISQQSGKKIVSGFFSIKVKNMRWEEPDIPLTCAFRGYNAFY